MSAAGFTAVAHILTVNIFTVSPAHKRELTFMTNWLVMWGENIPRLRKLGAANLPTRNSTQSAE